MFYIYIYIYMERCLTLEEVKNNTVKYLIEQIFFFDKPVAGLVKKDKFLLPLYHLYLLIKKERRKEIPEEERIDLQGKIEETVNRALSIMGNQPYLRSRFCADSSIENRTRILSLHLLKPIMTKFLKKKLIKDLLRNRGINEQTIECILKRIKIHPQDNYNLWIQEFIEEFPRVGGKKYYKRKYKSKKKKRFKNKC